MVDVVVDKGSSFEWGRLSTAKRLVDFNRRGSLPECGWGADRLGGSGQ